MKLLKTRMVRFSAVVEECGRPEIYTMWQKPKTDRHFQMLLKNSRVMTTLPGESGTDFGLIGFVTKKGARYLVFPKSLKRFADQRVIGMKWELIRT